MKFRPKDRCVEVGSIEQARHLIGEPSMVVLEPSGRAYTMTQAQMLEQFEPADDDARAFVERAQGAAIIEGVRQNAMMGLVPQLPQSQSFPEGMKGMRMAPTDDGGFEIKFLEDGPPRKTPRRRRPPPSPENGSSSTP